MKLNIVAILMALTLCARVQATTLIDQVAAMTPGTWTTIVTENLASDVDPAKDPSANPNFPSGEPWRGTTGFKALFTAWNSADFSPSLGPCGSIVHAGAGHLDYYGNTVVALDLCGGTGGAPVWKRIGKPYAGPIAFPTSTGNWPDGSPDLGHTYDLLTVAGTQMVIGASQITDTPTFVPYAFSFDLTTGQWSGPFPTTYNYHHGSSAFDSKRNLVWWNEARLASFDPATKAVRDYGANPSKPYVNGVGALMDYDSDRDMLVVQQLRFAPYNIAERTLPTTANDAPGPWVAVPQINRPALTHGQGAWQYSPNRHAFIAWMPSLNDGKVYEVKRTPDGYVWTLLTAANSTVIPGPASAAGNGSYDKAQLITVGDAEVLLVTLAPATGTYAFRLPGTVAPPPPPPPQPNVCASAGVVICDKFDGSPLAGTLNPASSGMTEPYVSDGMLHMEIVSGGGKDTGHYRVRLPNTGEGGFLAWSYGKRLDAEAMRHEGQKDWIVWGPAWAPSCTGQQLVQTHRYAGMVPIVYRSCGAPQLKAALPDGDYVWQNGDFDCRYRAAKRGDYSKCHVKRADQWADYYFELRVGHYGQMDSNLTGYVRTNGEWRKLYDWPVTLPNTVALEAMMLTSYMTDEIAYAHPTGHVDFRRFIVSTQPLDKALL